MNKTEIKKAFFKSLSIKNNYSLKEIDCDICGDNKKRYFKKYLVQK